VGTKRSPPITCSSPRDGARTHAASASKTRQIEVGTRGELRVNRYLQTSRPEVYAAGDVLGDPMFVYVAAYGGHLAAENAIRGNVREYDLSALPRVTFRIRRWLRSA
jgi:pyruvate/2-oxoglutarate dehydrogenase complex dihydrolipoamide dehydrogenase (E3) component